MKEPCTKHTAGKVITYEITLLSLGLVPLRRREKQSETLYLNDTKRESQCYNTVQGKMYIISLEAKPQSKLVI